MKAAAQKSCAGDAELEVAAPADAFDRADGPASEHPASEANGQATATKVDVALPQKELALTEYAVMSAVGAALMSYSAFAHIDLPSRS